MYKSFEEYSQVVVNELGILLPNVFKDTVVNFTYPFVDETIPLINLTGGFPFTLNRPQDSECYHDEQHLVEVASLALYYMYNEKDCELRVSDGVVVYLAGLLHDVEHSLGLKDDTFNISKTIKRVRKELPSSGMYRELVIKAIEATKFPRTRDPNNLIERCLMDADLTAITLSKTSGSDLVGKLLGEINRAKEVKEESLITTQQFVMQQADFKDNIKLFTKEAKKLYSVFSGSMMTQLQGQL